MNDPNPYDLPPEPQPLDTDAHPHTADQIPSSEECNLAMIAHVTGLIGVFSGGFVGFVGPLIVYLIKKDTSYFVESQAKEALNFQITMFVLAFALGIVVAISCGVLFPLLFVVPLLEVIFGILATITVRDGTPYSYPINFRFFR